MCKYGYNKIAASSLFYAFKTNNDKNLENYVKILQLHSKMTYDEIKNCAKLIHELGIK